MILRLLSALLLVSGLSPPTINIRDFMGKNDNGGDKGGIKSKIKYVSDPENDLFKITSSQASTLSKSWINMIQSSTPSEIGFEKPEDYVKYRVESYGFLYDGINRLEKYITDHRNDNDLYLAWQPKISGKHNKRNILFIIGTEIDLTNKVFNVNTIVQSPIWKGSHQIDTIELKKALDIVNRKANCTDINFEPLKESDIRYYWSWFSQTKEKPNLGIDTNKSHSNNYRFDKKIDIEYYIDDEYKDL